MICPACGTRMTEVTAGDVGELFDKQLAAQLGADEATAEREKKVANVFKYICPSYYLAGYKPWGSL